MSGENIEKLKKYYEVFLKNNSQGVWIKSLTQWVEIVQKIKQNVSIENYESINEKLQELSKETEEDFIQRYFEMPRNSIASIMGGSLHADKAEEFRKKLSGNKDNIVQNLFHNYTNIKELKEFLESYIIENKGGKSRKAVINRYLLTLFPDKFTAIASGGMFDKLIKLLNKQLSIEIDSKDYIEQNQKLMSINLGENDNEENKYKKQIFYWWLLKMMDSSLFKNIIYHGAPGTGKTYELKQEINEHLEMFNAKDNQEFVQFHGAYGYEDFIGGLKPDNSNKENGLQLKFTNGIFKDLCQKAGQYEKAYYDSDYYKNLPKDKQEPLNDKTPLDIKYTDGADLKLTIKSKDNKDNKEFTIKAKIPILSQFPPFFILIDEINRADLSRVFGELLYAIEDDYRGFENRFKLSTSSMETEEDAVYWNEEQKQAYFFVPKNIYIRGTMNDIDKSVDSIDFAFRRRFKWVNKKFEADKIEEIFLSKNLRINDIDKYKASCKKLNEKIIEDISIADESYYIGHAIFANIARYITSKTITQEAKEELFDNHMEQIIYNYLKMDYGNDQTDTKKFRDCFVKGKDC